MFKKKKCEKCGEKIEEKYSFCPYCGNGINEENEDDFGMLGKNDFMSIGNEIKLPMGLNALFNSLVKNLSKEFEEQAKGNFPKNDVRNVKKDGISISISTFGNGAPKIKVSQLGNKKPEEKPAERIKKNSFTKEQIKQFSTLKRVEPITHIRRLSNKISYEIEMPDVKSIEDISIINLENSIEIRAIGEKKSYAKIIPISLPVKKYELSEGRLILELGIKN